MTAVTERYTDTLARLGTSQKSAKGAPAYSRFVNRKAGRYLAAWAYHRGLTPNAVTGISACFTFAAITALALVEPTAIAGLLIGVGLILGYAFDAADGQLARLRGGGSKSGEWLDHMVDATKISALHSAVLITAYRHFHLQSVAWLLVPLAFLLVANVTFFGMILLDSLRRIAAGRSVVVLAAPSTLRALLVIPTDYGVLCLAFLLLGANTVFFGVYCFLATASSGFLLLAAVKWFGDAKAIDES